MRAAGCDPPFRFLASNCRPATIIREAVSRRKERVFLILEPGQLALSTRKLILEAAGYNVLSAVTGKQALEFCKNHPVDAAILDNETPDVPLSELIDRLRAFRDMPVYLLSHRAWPPDDIKHKVTDVFEKISDPREMVKAIAAHFGDETEQFAGF